jgi:hypothetical protein
MRSHDDRRNPYLVLGLPYGSPTREVRKGFARRSREVSRGDLTAYTTEDLTWALSQIELSEIDPEIDFSMYRIPANPKLFESANETGGVLGFFNPVPEPIARATALISADHVEQLLDEAVLDWTKNLLDRGANDFRIPYPFPE